MARPTSDEPVGIAPPNERELDELLSRPDAATVAALRACPGDIVVLGAGGKMGPSLCMLAARAALEADGGSPRRVIAVSRFRSGDARDALRDAGVETLSADLLDPAAVRDLPDAPNVIFMAGQKFGTSDSPAMTWMMNVVVPAYCARRYAGSRIVAFSTGNVYALTAAEKGGAREADDPGPIGEYAASCLGRERVFEHAALSMNSRVAIMRLNYAIDLRYGVLTDIALRVLERRPISLAMGHVNLIWQGDANRIALRMLEVASSPATKLNVTGADTHSVRNLAIRIGERLGVKPEFEGSEAPDALLSDTERLQNLLQPRLLPIDTMLDWVSEWVSAGRPLLGKPTGFEKRDGAF